MGNYDRTKLAWEALIRVVTSANSVCRAADQLHSAIELAERFGPVWFVEPVQPTDDDELRAMTEQRLRDLPQYLASVQQWGDTYARIEQEFRATLTRAQVAVNEAAPELDLPTTPALGRYSVAILRAIGQLSGSVPNALFAAWNDCTDPAVIDGIKKQCFEVQIWIQELRLLVVPDHSMPVETEPVIHTSTTVVVRSASTPVPLKAEDIALNADEFALFASVREYLIDVANRDQFRSAVEFINDNYSDAAMDAKAPPKGEPPPGYVWQERDAANESYRVLGAFIKESLTWDLSDLGDAERSVRAHAVLYVAWVVTDPDAGSRGVDLSPLERKPWDTAGGDGLGRWWMKMLAFGMRADVRQRWLELVRIAWLDTQQVRRRSAASSESAPIVATAMREPEELAGPPSPSGEFRSAGTVWMIGLGTTPRPIASKAGFVYICELLRNAGQEVAVEALFALRKGALPPTLSPDDVVDEDAVRDVSATVARLGEERGLAEAQGDELRAQALDSQIETIQSHATRTLGVSGKPRRSGDEEKIRNSVGAAIRDALGALEKHDAALFDHLQSSLVGRAGFAPRYQPTSQVRWQLD